MWMDSNPIAGIFTRRRKLTHAERKDAMDGKGRLEWFS